LGGGVHIFARHYRHSSRIHLPSLLPSRLRSAEDDGFDEADSTCTSFAVDVVTSGGEGCHIIPCKMMAVTRPTRLVPPTSRRTTARRKTNTTINRCGSLGAQPRGTPSGRICTGWGNGLKLPHMERGEDAEAEANADVQGRHRRDTQTRSKTWQHRQGATRTDIVTHSTST